MERKPASGPPYYKVQSRFVNRNHPFGDDARFRAGLPGLREVLRAAENPEARAAIDKLLHLKSLRGAEIYHLIRRIGASSDEPIEWPKHERRTAEQLARNCKKLADEIALAKWPFGAGFIPRDYFEWRELPRLLRSYASAWEKQLSHYYRSARSPRNINIIHLLDFVKDRTGQPHYARVAALLNATDNAYGWETKDVARWDVRNLREMMKRKKKAAGEPPWPPFVGDFLR